MAERARGDDFVDPADRAELARPTTLDGITAEWHKSTDALHDSERRYRELVEYSLGLICTHDLTGVILSINPAAAQSLDYRPEDGIGQNLRDFLAPETRHLFDDYLARMQQNGNDAGLMRVVTRTGNHRVWMYRNVLSRDRGGSPYVLGHAIDITQRVVAERTLRDSEQALRRAHEELENRVRERTAALEFANERLKVEIAERERAEQSRERALIEQRDTLAFMATLSDQLAPLLKFDELVDLLRRLPVPFLADWTMVHSLDEAGNARCLPGAHRDPGRRTVLAALAESAAGPIAPDSPLAAAMTSRELTVVTPSPEESLVRLFGAGPVNELLAQAGAASAAILPLVADGRVQALVSIVSANQTNFSGPGRLIIGDLTRRVRLALDRIQLYHEAQDANRLKDEFLSTLSHELRTPLNAIFGWARILRARDLDAATAHAVAVIERNAESQMRLIEDVLDVSRIITGKMMLALSGVEIRGILRAAIDAVRPALQAKGIRFTEDFGQTVPEVAGDAHRLQQVFWNVLSNAVKFTSRDGVIAVSLRTVERTVECEITDTGIGIRRDVLPFVFDRFRQADSSTTRTHGGLGLGLAIVRHIVELHGGSVKASSAGEGRGATFTIRLPVGGAHSAPESPPPLPPRPAAHVGVVPLLRGRTMLVVEDHDDARELLAGVMEAAGGTVISAASTEEAMERVAHTRPDMLIADIGLPGQDGYTLLRRVRALHGVDVPAIALTAFARATDRDRALAAGFQHHVVKPIDPRQFVEIVASTLPPR